MMITNIIKYATRAFIFTIIGIVIVTTMNTSKHEPSNPDQGYKLMQQPGKVQTERAKNSTRPPSHHSHKLRPSVSLLRPSFSLLLKALAFIFLTVEVSGLHFPYCQRLQPAFSLLLKAPAFIFCSVEGPGLHFPYCQRLRLSFSLLLKVPAFICFTVAGSGIRFP